MKSLVSKYDLNHALRLGIRPKRWIAGARSEDGRILPNTTLFYLGDNKFSAVMSVQPVYYETKWGTWRPMREIAPKCGNKKIRLIPNALQIMSPRFLNWLIKRQELFGEELLFDYGFMGAGIQPRQMVFATTLTEYPDPSPETTTCDGTLDYTDASWSTAQTATAAENASDSLTYLIGQASTAGCGRNGGNSLWKMDRSVTGFDTSAIGSSSTIDDGTVSLTESSSGAMENSSNTGNDVLFPCSATLAANTAIAVGDWDGVGDSVSAPTHWATGKDYGSMTTAGGVEDWTLNATGESGINKTGVTNIGWRSGDDITAEPTGFGGGDWNKWAAESADHASGEAVAPKLVVNYTAGGSSASSSPSPSVSSSPSPSSSSSPSPSVSSSPSSSPSPSASSSPSPSASSSPSPSASSSPSPSESSSPSSSVSSSSSSSPSPSVSSSPSPSISSSPSPSPSPAATDVKNDATLSTSLVSYWELEEASGDRVDSHSTNDLTENNTVGQGTGIRGNAADIERSNSEYLDISDAAQAGLDITPDISLSVWVKLESSPSSNDTFPIINKYKDTSGDRQWSLSYDDVSGQKRLVWRTSADGITVNSDHVVQTLTAGTWYHIVVAHDGSAGEAEIYVNGVPLGPVTGYDATIVNGTARFSLGKEDGQVDYFDGLIDEVGVWSKVISYQEVADLHNNGAGIPYNSGASPSSSPSSSPSPSPSASSSPSSSPSPSVSSSPSPSVSSSPSSSPSPSVSSSPSASSSPSSSPSPSVSSSPSPSVSSSVSSSPSPSPSESASVSASPSPSVSSSPSPSPSPSPSAFIWIPVNKSSF